jgi:hypothetical protein
MWLVPEKSSVFRLFIVRVPVEGRFELADVAEPP